MQIWFISNHDGVSRRVDHMNNYFARQSQAKFKVEIINNIADEKSIAIKLDEMNGN
jgi:hypothetical protein